MKTKLEQSRRNIEVSFYNYNDELETIIIRTSMQRNIESQLKKVIDNLTYDDVVIESWREVA